MIAVRKKTKLKEGVNDISNHDYHTDTEYKTSSMLKLAYSDYDLYYRKYVEKEDMPSYGGAHFTTGTYLHALLLEPDTIADTFVIYKGTRRGKAWTDFKAQNPNKESITQTDYGLGEQLLNNIDFHSKLLLTGGVAEQTICGSLYGHKIKVRPDYINVDKGYIVDVKTTRTLLDIESLTEVINTYHYDLAVATYSDIAECHYNKSFDYYFLFVCKNPIHTRLIKASAYLHNKGVRKLKEALFNIDRPNKQFIQEV